MKRIKKILSNPIYSLALALGFTALVLFLVFKDNYKEILQLLGTVSPLWFLILFLLVIGYHFLIGWNLKILINARHVKYSFLDGLVNAIIASFWHGVTPSASGGQVGQMYVFHKQKVESSIAAGALWADFIIYQATMVIVVLMLILLRFSYFRSNFSNLFLFVILGFIVNSFVIVVLFCGVKFKRLYTFVTQGIINLLDKFHLIKDKARLAENLNLQLTKFTNCAEEFSKEPIVILKCVALQVLRLLIYYSIPFFVYLSMTITPTIDANTATLLLDCICLTSYVTMINAFIPIPGASGGTEAIFVLMFTTLFGGVQASAIMALWRFYTYYLLMVIGAITFILFKNFYTNGTIRTMEGSE